MINILLICAGGISSGLFAKKVESEYEACGESAEVNAIGFPLLSELINTVDVVLVAPQLKYNEKLIAEICEKNNKHYIMIENSVYVTQNAKKIKASIESIMKGE